MGYSKKCPAQKRHSKWLIFSLDKLVIKHSVPSPRAEAGFIAGSRIKFLLAWSLHSTGR